MGWLFVILLPVLVLAVVLLVRTAWFHSHQMRHLIADDIQIEIGPAAKRLSGAVQIRTLSFEENGEVDPAPFLGFRAYLEQQFPRIHAALKKEVLAGDSLVFIWAGTDASLKPVLLMAHSDVVPVLDESGSPWTCPPYSGEIKDGFIWGRGTLDDKGSLMGILEAVEYLLEKEFIPKRTVMLAFGHDEEVGGLKGAAVVAAALAERGVTLEFILDEGGAVVQGLFGKLVVAALGIAEKGYVTVKLTMEGRAGHSSQPPAHTTIGLLADAIRQVESHPHPLKLAGVVASMLDYLGPEMPFHNRMVLANHWLFAPVLTQMLGDVPSTRAMMHTTQAVTMIAGGYKDNILPPTALAAVNCRILPGETVEQTVDYLRKITANPALKVEPVPGFCNEPSAISDNHSPAFRLIQKSISQVFPQAVVAPYLVTGGTDSKHFVQLSQAIFRFSPMMMTTDDLQRIHGRDERVALKAYEDMIRFYVQLLMNASQ